MGAGHRERRSVGSIAMNSLLASAHEQLARAHANMKTPLRWIVTPHIFDGARNDMEKAGALICEVGTTPTIFGLPYDFGGTHSATGIDLIVQGCD